MRAPIVVIAVVGALVLGGTAAAVAVTAPTPRQPSTTQPASGGPVGDMRQLHERMLRDNPEMGAIHDRMLTEHPEMRSMHDRMMGGS